MADTKTELEQVQSELAALQASYDALAGTAGVQQTALSALDLRVTDLEDLEQRIAALEAAAGASGLVVSSYEVDCNQAALYQNTGSYRCDLAIGVDPADVPLVQIYNLRDAGWHYFDEFSCYNSGANCDNADQSVELVAPGMGVRFDAAQGIIFTAPHWWGSTADTYTRYLVVVAGSTAFTAP